MTTDAEAEAAAAQIISLYRRHGRAWAALRGERLTERVWLDRFLDLVPAGGSILDLGCGPGVPIARYLIERGHPVTGVDASPEMLALARNALPQSTWELHDMRTLRLERRFSGIVAWDSFFHLTGAAQTAMFPVFAEHALPGAPLLFTTGPDAGVSIGMLEGEPLHHASLSGAAYRALLESSGFTVVEQRNEDPEVGRHTVWLARQRGAVTPP